MQPDLNMMNEIDEIRKKKAGAEMKFESPEVEERANIIILVDRIREFKKNHVALDLDEFLKKYPEYKDYEVSLDFFKNIAKIISEIELLRSAHLRMSDKKLEHPEPEQSKKPNRTMLAMSLKRIYPILNEKLGRFSLTLETTGPDALHRAVLEYYRAEMEKNPNISNPELLGFKCESFNRLTIAGLNCTPNSHGSWFSSLSKVQSFDDSVIDKMSSERRKHGFFQQFSNNISQDVKDAKISQTPSVKNVKKP